MSGFLSIFFESTVLMWFLFFVFAVACIRCLIYGIAGGTSTLLRILATLLFAGLAYACWKNANTIHSSNVIDRFVFDSWQDIKHLWSVIKQKLF